MSLLAQNTPEISDTDAAAAMLQLGIKSDPRALLAYKQLGTWLVQHDVGATQLAKNFDSESQVDYAVKISRDLCENEDPIVRSKGVTSLLLAVKTRSALAAQAILLAQASQGKGRGGRNLPPVMNMPIFVHAGAATIPEKPAIPV